jgi:hypothetical protein
MKRLIAAMAVTMAMASGATAHAQETAAGSGVLDVTIVPGGTQFFVAGKNSGGPGFVDYGLGAGVQVNVNRYVGIEGEISGGIGVTQDLQFASGTRNVKTPNLLNYSGNLVLSAANRSAFVPYAAGGVGGLTLFDTSTLGISGDKTLLTGNVGGGLKWFSRSGRWGLRGDYRFIAVRSDDTAPAFFGQESRYGHRIYGGVLINAIR